MHLHLLKSLRPAWLALTTAILAACGLIEPTIAPGSVLFQDDFSSPLGGWSRGQEDQFLADYVDGGFLLSVLHPNSEAWSRPSLDFADVRLEVDVTKLSGPDDNLIGVLCRFQDAQNYAFLLISSDGYAGVGIVRDGVRSLLAGEVFMPHSAIAQGSAPNHIRAECSGDRLSLTVNGELVSEGRADAWAEGDVALFVGAYAVAGVEVRFDNFSVIQP